LLYGKVALLPSDLNTGFFACDGIKQYSYAPAQANKLLDDAGWVPGPDGIRIAKGAKYAPDDTRLRLKYSTTTEDKSREQAQLLIIEDLKAVGIEAYVENAPSSVVLGTWDGGSPRRRGNFDLVQYSSSAESDPHRQMVDLYASWQIASEKNKGGPNFSRFSDPRADDLLKQAEKEPDPTKRKSLYCQVAQLGYDAYNIIHLYQASRAYAYRERLQGWETNGWNNVGWNAENWWVSDQAK
jgi:peptide/nickel transport system substrate-binding protein